MFTLDVIQDNNAGRRIRHGRPGGEGRGEERQEDQGPEEAHRRVLVIQRPEPLHCQAQVNTANIATF